MQIESLSIRQDGSFNQSMRLHIKRNGENYTVKTEVSKKREFVKNQYDISFAIANRLLEQLIKAKKPTKPSCITGLDGAMYFVKIVTTEGTQEYSWWCMGDEGYQALYLASRRVLRVCRWMKRCPPKKS